MNFLIYVMVILSCYIVTAQDSEKKENQVMQIADNLLRENLRSFVVYKTGKVYTEASGLDPKSETDFLSEIPRWLYNNGHTNIAMLELDDFLKDQKYIEYSTKNYYFIFSNYKYFLGKSNGRDMWSYPFRQLLDNCGAMGAGAIDAFRHMKNEDTKEFIDVITNFIMNDIYRLNDSTYCRTKIVDKTIWADDLYMSVSFSGTNGEINR